MIISAHSWWHFKLSREPTWTLDWTQFMTLSCNKFSEGKGKLKCLKSQGEKKWTWLDLLYFVCYFNLHQFYSRFFSFSKSYFPYLSNTSFGKKAIINFLNFLNLLCTVLFEKLVFDDLFRFLLHTFIVILPTEMQSRQ